MLAERSDNERMDTNLNYEKDELNQVRGRERPFDESFA